MARRHRSGKSYSKPREQHDTAKDILLAAARKIDRHQEITDKYARQPKPRAVRKFEKYSSMGGKPEAEDEA